MSAASATTCPFCNLGCKLGFEVKEGEVRMVDYVTGSRNQGRLCPKGNAAAAVINHRKRLYNPLIGGQKATLSQAIEYLRQKLSEFKPDEVLVAYDASLTLDEVEALAGWVNEAGFKNLAYAAVGPEVAFLYGDAGFVTLDELTDADYAFIIGDPFAQCSVISGYLAQAKASKRDFRYIVVDSFATNTSSFASRFIRVRPGYEGLLVYGLWKYIAGKKVNLDSLADVLGVDAAIFGALSTMLRDKKGVLIWAPSLGRSFDCFLVHGACLNLSSVVDGMTYIPLGNRPPFGATKPFFSYLPLIMGGRIKAIVSFAARFPWGFSQLRPMLRKTELISAGSLFIPEGRFEFEVVLPLASELEKDGKIKTIFGEEQIKALVPGVSGTLAAAGYIARLGGSSKQTLPLAHPALDERVLDERADALLSDKEKPKKGMRHLLVGAEPAIGYLEIFQDENWISLNPQDLISLGLKEGNAVGVETEQGDVELRAVSSSEVPSGLAVVSTNHQASVALFELGTDQLTGEALLKPMWSRVWKK